jgi:hypothetical protein
MASIPAHLMLLLLASTKISKINSLSYTYIAKGETLPFGFVLLSDIYFVFLLCVFKGMSCPPSIRLVVEVDRRLIAIPSLL